MPQNEIISSFSALSSISVLISNAFFVCLENEEILFFETAESEGIKFVPDKARLKESCTGRAWNQSSAAGRRFYAF